MHIWPLYKVSSIWYMGKVFRKTNISHPLIRTCKCEYYGVRNVSFSENLAYLLNEWSLTKEALPGLLKKSILCFYSLTSVAKFLRRMRSFCVLNSCMSTVYASEHFLVLIVILVSVNHCILKMYSTCR